MENTQVIYEDNHLIAVNKLAGWLVQGDKTGDATLSDWVKRYIKIRYDKPGDVFLGTIHRLDRPVSGVTLFARTSKALERMNKKFQLRQVEKTYWAVVMERPNPISDKLVHFLIKDRERNVTKAYTRPKLTAKRAELNYQMIAEVGEHRLLEVQLLTGRPHQIRVQLSKMGCPIRGDRKYGARYKNQVDYIHLHAKRLAFDHPITKEPIAIEAALPDEQIWRLFDGIQGLGFE